VHLCPIAGTKQGICWTSEKYHAAILIMLPKEMDREEVKAYSHRNACGRSVAIVKAAHAHAVPGPGAGALVVVL
jgi:hypothetical protein